MTTTVTPPEALPAEPPPVRARRGWLRRSWDNYWYAWAMVLPVVAVLSVLVLYPLGRGIWISFTNLNEANQQSEICTRTLGGDETCEPNPNAWEFTGLRNYTRVLSGEVDEFWLQAVNTLVWTFACVLFHYLIGLGLAVMLNRQLRGRAIYRVLIILPWAVPSFIVAFSWKFLFNEQFGLINAALSSIGIDPVAWFADRWTSLFTAIVTNIWLGIPFMVVALLGGLQSIPDELYEAAEVDGASAWQRFRNVTLPGLRPVSLTVILLAFIQTDRRFTLAYGLQQFVPQFNPLWEYLTASAVLVTIPAGIVFFFAQRHLVAGLTAGSTKG